MEVGRFYYKVHVTKSHTYGPRKFLGVTEFGYATFEGPEAGQVMSESPQLWTFYAEGEARPIVNPIPEGWVEGPDGGRDPRQENEIVRPQQ